VGYCYWIVTFFLLILAPAARAQTTLTLLAPADSTDGLNISLDEFGARTGIAITVESVADVEAAASERVAAGSPPDLALLPHRALVEQAREGHLMPLVNADGGAALVDFFVLSDNFSPALIDTGRVEGTAYGVLVRAGSRSAVWYRLSAFDRQTLAPPATWDELVALVERLRAAGDVPWSIALADDAALTHWFENIYARSAGVEAYRRLFETGETRWVDDSVLAALDHFSAVIYPQSIAPDSLNVAADEAFDAVFGDNPTAAMLLGGLDAAQYDRLDSRAVGGNYGYFALPPIDAETHGAPVIVDGDWLVAFSDSESAALAVRWLASVESAALWAHSGGILSPNAHLDQDVYRAAAVYEVNQIVTAAHLLPSGAGMLHPERGRALADALRTISANPGDARAAMAFLDSMPMR
jgi:alpha-glucoside transport system substrate-binding protein